MRGTRIILGVLFSSALSLALAGCASARVPAPAGQDDCLVIIKSKNANPSFGPNVWSFFIVVSPGADQAAIPNKGEAYIAVKVRGPNPKIIALHSRRRTERESVDVMDSSIGIPLPYRPGCAVIADFGLALSIAKPEMRTSEYFRTFPVSGDERRLLLEELKAREGIEAWRFEE